MKKKTTIKDLAKLFAKNVPDLDIQFLNNLTPENLDENLDKLNLPAKTKFEVKQKLHALFLEKCDLPNKVILTRRDLLSLQYVTVEEFYLLNTELQPDEISAMQIFCRDLLFGFLQMTVEYDAKNEIASVRKALQSLPKQFHGKSEQHTFQKLLAFYSDQLQEHETYSTMTSVLAMMLTYLFRVYNYSIIHPID